jgi:hypothetical protein
MLFSAKVTVSWSMLTLTHLTGIGGDVIDAIRHNPTKLLDDKVMDPNLFWIARGPVLGASFLEVPRPTPGAGGAAVRSPQRPPAVPVGAVDAAGVSDPASLAVPRGL